jgi:hypothetical protein
MFVRSSQADRRATKLPHQVAISAMGRCIIHVGHPKTGSTYLQTVLHLNEDVLQQAGFWVPSDFRQFDSYHCRDLAESGQIFSGNMQAVFEAYEAQQPERVNALLHHILYSGAENLILSSELLFYYNYVVWDIGRRAAMAGYQVLVIAYLARQDRAAVGDYLQNVRNHGYHGGVLAFLESKRREKHLQYAEVVKTYNLEAPGRAVVRTFDPQFLLGRELLSDFFAVSRCPLKTSDLRLPEGSLNTGLPLEWCEVLRGLNAGGDPAAASIRDAAPQFGSAERARIMEHYFREEVRDFVLSEYVSGNHNLIETHLADRSEQEKAYWLRVAPAGRGVELDASQMAGCLTHIRGLA